MHYTTHFFSLNPVFNKLVDKYLPLNQSLLMKNIKLHIYSVFLFQRFLEKDFK